MARTWSLYDTELITGYELETFGIVAQVKDNLYFVGSTNTGNQLGNHKVYSYDIAGKTLTDISGGAFTGTYGIADICRFQNSIYALYRYDTDGLGLYYQKISKYSGVGQTWADTWTLEDGGDPAVIGQTADNRLDANFSKIYVAVYGETVQDAKIFASSDGVSFTEGSTPSDYEIVGIYADTQHSGYPNPLSHTSNAGVDSNNAVQESGGSWTYALGSAVSLSSRVLVGYGDGYSFWRNTATGALSKSTDWGQNLTALGLTNTAFSTRDIQNLAGGRVIMIHGPGATNQAYTWNFSTKLFVADGTTGGSSNIITTFFMDTDGGLYALCNDAVANTVTIYKAEVLDLKAVFYQTAYISDPTLNLKFALPFKGVNARGLDSNNNDARALVGSRDPSATPVVVSLRPWAGYQSHSVNHPTDTEIVKVGWL